MTTLVEEADIIRFNEAFTIEFQIQCNQRAILSKGGHLLFEPVIQGFPFEFTIFTNCFEFITKKKIPVQYDEEKLLLFLVGKFKKFHFNEDRFIKYVKRWG